MILKVIISNYITRLLFLESLFNYIKHGEPQIANTGVHKLMNNMNIDHMAQSVTGSVARPCYCAAGV